MNFKRILSVLALVCTISTASFADICPETVLTHKDSPYEVVSKQDLITPNKFVLSGRDTLTHTERWSIEIKDIGWRMTRDKVLLFNLGYIKVLDLASGKELWGKESKGNPIQPVYVTDNILVVYKVMGSGLLRGLDLATGEVVWKKSLDCSKGWSFIEPISADSAWVAADNLYRIDWNTGKSDKFSIKSGFTNGKKLASLMATSLAMGIVTAGLSGGAITSYLIPTSSTNKVGLQTTNALLPVYPDNMNIAGTVSNLITSGNLHYIADRNNLMCFDDNLNLVWRYDFPERRGSSSHLILRDGVIYMVNLGKAIRENDPEYATGIPFTAAFNAQNGVPYWYKELSEKKQAIKDFHFEGTDEIVIQFEDNTIRQMLTDGKMIVTE